MKALGAATLAVLVALGLLLPSDGKADQPTIKTFWTTDGVGNPWGTAVDGSGKVWFAEPGCDFAPTCPADAPAGQIGKLDPASGATSYYTLPNIPGNQPIFLAFDDSGKLWFTTPGNDMIGEFSPSTGTFLGQWPVTPGSGPWDLVFANGQLWYTEHLASAVGVFDPGSKAHQDFQTPSASSNPYGIAASGGRIWFTENNGSVDRIAAIDTDHGNAISEYAIVLPLDGTPHMITVDSNGHPWWTEGWSNTIATLDPGAATPGSCGLDEGTCKGVQRYDLPASAACGGEAHASGIAFDARANRLWLDNSLTSQVGSFTPSTSSFAMNKLSSCSAHPHDGLSLDAAGNVWFAEEFINAIGELVAPSAPPPPAGSSPPSAPGGVLPAGSTSTPSPANTSAPTIRGDPRQSRTLTARTGSWTNAPTRFSYSWQRCRRRCVKIARATGRSYRLAASDVDAKMRVIVTAGNSGGTGQATSRGRGPVGPSMKRVKQALGQLLASSTKRRTVETLLEKGGYRGSFHAPSGGDLMVTWRAKSSVIARAHVHFPRAGAGNVTTRLTRTAKRLLKPGNRLIARVSFAASGEPAVTQYAITKS